MMTVDLEWWDRLRREVKKAAQAGPRFHEVQEAQRRAAIARNQLEHFRANGPQGRASGRPIVKPHRGEEVSPGMGGHGPDDIVRAFERDVAELTSRAAATEAEYRDMAESMRECNAIHSELHHLEEDIRRLAREQVPPIVLPGDDGHFEPPSGITGSRRVHVPAASPDARSVVPQSAGPSGSGAPPAASGSFITRMMERVLS